MAQFPMTESRKRILEKIPDYAVDISPSEVNVRVSVGDKVIADCSRALLIKESRHDDVYYLHRNDVDMSVLTKTEHSTYCPFKGHATYWSFGELDNLVWSYEDPYPEVAPLKDYLSFYTNRVAQTIS